MRPPNLGINRISADSRSCALMLNIERQWATKLRSLKLDHGVIWLGRQEQAAGASTLTHRVNGPKPTSSFSTLQSRHSGTFGPKTRYPATFLIGSTIAHHCPHAPPHQRESRRRRQRSPPELPSVRVAAKLWLNLGIHRKMHPVARGPVSRPIADWKYVAGPSLQAAADTV